MARWGHRVLQGASHPYCSVHQDTHLHSIPILEFARKTSDSKDFKILLTLTKSRILSRGHRLLLLLDSKEVDEDAALLVALLAVNGAIQEERRSLRLLVSEVIDPVEGLERWWTETLKC